METRVAVMSIIVENGEMVETLNAILHSYSEFIIGRMGIPYRKRGVSIIAIALAEAKEVLQFNARSWERFHSFRWCSASV